MNRYVGPLPVTQTWADEHDGEVWEFTLPFLLDDLIYMGGIDAMNEACDVATGIVLTDLSYRVGPSDANKTVVLIEATGTVSES